MASAVLMPPVTSAESVEVALTTTGTLTITGTLPVASAVVLPGLKQSTELVSTPQAVVLLAKGFVGIGWLAVPYGYGKAHIMGALFFGILVLGFVMVGMLALHDIYYQFYLKPKPEGEPGEVYRPEDLSYTQLSRSDPPTQPSRRSI